MHDHDYNVLHAGKYSSTTELSIAAMWLLMMQTGGCKIYNYSLHLGGSICYGDRYRVDHISKDVERGCR